MPHTTVQTEGGMLTANAQALRRIIKRLCLASLLLSFATVSRAQYVTFMEYDLTHGQCCARAITTGPDGAMWVLGRNNTIYRITTAGTITSYEKMPNANASHITAGPDGALWISVPLPGGPSQIARITTAGVITMYSVSTSEVGLGDITAGPDGALWFTERSGNRIGRITTAGKLTEYPLPKPNSHPIAITTGPDGALWFTEAGAIGRITTAGAITEYAVAGWPSYITAGPDGALWFTETYENRIGRVTTAGVITEYAIPTPNSEPWGITAGPDGALWFTENSSADAIGRITTDGVITEYPASDLPAYITTGPDGALWFTFSDMGGRVRRAVLDLTSGSMPQLASGGSWKTTITIMNTGAAPAGVTLNLFSDKGDPLTLPFTSPQLPGSLPISTITFPMLPYSLLVVETELPADQPVQQGWAQLVASRAVSASAVFRWNLSAGPQEAVVPLETRNGSYVLPFDNTDFATGVAVANLAPIPASIPVIVRDELGILLGTDTIQLPAHGHTSFMLADPNHSAVMARLTVNRRGTVEFDRPPAGQISVLGIRACPTGALTSIPVAMK